MLYVSGSIVFLLLTDKKQDCLNTQQLIHPGILFGEKSNYNMARHSADWIHSKLWLASLSRQRAY